MTTQTPPKLEELLEEWRDIEADWYENISPPLSLAESYEAFIKKVYEAGKNKGFERGWKEGKIAGIFKERMKHEPDVLKKSLEKVIKILGQNQHETK